VRQFFDTNVLVYAHDLQDRAKAELARSLVEDAMSRHDFVVSTQVLAEFYSTVTRRRLLEPSSALEMVRLWAEHDTVAQTPDLMLRGIPLHQKHSIAFWDALVIQAALDAKCDLLFSEDFQHGRRFGEMEIRNPFIAGEVHEPRVASYGRKRPVKRRAGARAG
jgi:predicted nucleic acid-binding protein